MKTNTVNQYVSSNSMITSDCVSIAFYRPSGTNQNVTVNGIPIDAGQTLTISQLHGNIDITQYDVRFEPQGNHPAQLHVLRQVLVR